MKFKKDLLYKLTNYSSIVWTLCVIGLVTVFALASEFATHDPDFSFGNQESIYLLPMLSIFFLGLISFCCMVLFSVLNFFQKGQNASYKPLLGLSTKKMVLLTAIVLFGVFSFFFGMRQVNVGRYSEEVGAVVTGDEVFSAVNDYRVSQGLKTVTIDEHLCDNLVQRYLDLVNPDNKYVGHAGFEKWAKEEGLVDSYELAEVYVTDIRSGAEAVKFWLGSPGHKNAILGEYHLGCAYANQGVGVMILGNKLLK